MATSNTRYRVFFTKVATSWQQYKMGLPLTKTQAYKAKEKLVKQGFDVRIVRVVRV